MFDSVPERKPDSACAAEPAAQIGHNRGPSLDTLSAFDLYRIFGPAPAPELPAFECGAPWTGRATDEELVEVSRITARIELRERAIRELRAQRKRIMMRCIRRKRRAEGRE